MKTYQPWPSLSADDFKPSSHLLYMCTQIIGKLMLTRPFTPHWANLAMPITSRGFTTGLIPYAAGTFSVDMDCIDHVLVFTSSWGKLAKLKLSATSVAKLYSQIFAALNSIDVNLKINVKPQETSNLTPFDQDNEPCVYDEKVVNAWWRILVSTTRVLQQFHSQFYGITPEIGLCWGTLDLRDARYRGIFQPTASMDFITRNAMDDEQFEVGFSASNEKYPLPAFFAFAYPKPAQYEQSQFKNPKIKWVDAVKEFILDYSDLSQTENPEGDLLDFCISTFQAFSKQANWDPKLVVSGKPV